MDLKKQRQQVWNEVPEGVQLCAVTKGRTVGEVESLLQDIPQLKIIGENRWPDCEEKFLHFSQLERHFIGPLQSNKVRKVIPLIDVIQSVDSLKLLSRINSVAGELGKTIKFTFQVNISEDQAKSGISPGEISSIMSQYKDANLQYVELIGLMTIGEITNSPEQYFHKSKTLFDQVTPGLPILSMGMSKDYPKAVQQGATMVRIGRALF